MRRRQHPAQQHVSRRPFLLHHPSHLLPRLQRFLPGGRVATKSSDGCMCIWHLSSGSSQGSQGSSAAALEAVAAWRVPHCSGGGGWANRCQFGTTRDGRYIAVVSWQPGPEGEADQYCCMCCAVMLSRRCTRCACRAEQALRLPQTVALPAPHALRCSWLSPCNRATAAATATCLMRRAGSVCATCRRSASQVGGMVWSMCARTGGCDRLFCGWGFGLPWLTIDDRPPAACPPPLLQRRCGRAGCLRTADTCWPCWARGSSSGGMQCLFGKCASWRAWSDGGDARSVCRR